jgi:hypothetical protein
MTLRPGEVPGRAIAVFPFLKTTHPITLGDFTFRSTDDTTGLDAEDAAHVREIADMLYLQDDLRIRSAAYAILPAVDLDKDEVELTLAQLERIQAVVAFCYSHPHRTFGEPFFSFEQASLVIFSPEPVSIFMVRPERHVVATGAQDQPKEDDWHRVPGYYGRYNFLHPFWVVKNSRLYPPVPHIGLNQSQDLAYDLESCFQSQRYRLLPELLKEARTQAGERVFKAVRWFNRANTLDGDEHSAILNLSVAFETLLGLPRDSKTDRFVDAVSLLLGRVERLDSWAEQFYEVRSDVSHEGETRRLHFAPQRRKGQEESALYQPHLVYGRQIFQQCTGTVLFGASLAEEAGIAEKFVTNEERLRFICKTLDDESLTVANRFKGIAQTVAVIDSYRFVGETGLLIKTLVGAVQNAAQKLLISGDPLDPLLKGGIETLANAPRSTDSYEALDALRNLHDLRMPPPADWDSPEAITLRLVDVVWHYTFMHYFWLAEQRKNKTTRA